MTINEKAEEFLTHFEIKKRGEDSIIILKDNAPEALHNSVREAHGERLPSDWIYDKYHSILDAISGYTIENVEDLNDNRSEIVDGLVDVYTSDLTAWLNSSNYNVYYLTEAKEECGPEADGFNLLMMAQYKAIDEIFSTVVELLESEI